MIDEETEFRGSFIDAADEGQSQTHVRHSDHVSLLFVLSLTLVTHDNVYDMDRYLEILCKKK